MAQDLPSLAPHAGLRYTQATKAGPGTGAGTRAERPGAVPNPPEFWSADMYAILVPR